MNFLAHIYLSGNNEQVKVGNFIGDWIKGNGYKSYPQDIQTGILLHRAIDSFTDNHLIVKKSKNRLSEKYHKYSGIIIDIFYDHFLSVAWNRYSNMQLPDFTKNLNNCLEQNMQFLPVEIQEFIPKFMKHRWMESYGTIDGIKNVLNGMSRNTSLPNNTDYAIDILKIHYNSFQEEFEEYFSLLIKHVEDKFGILLSNK